MSKVARLEVRLDPADDFLIRRAAEVAGTTVSAFVLASARMEAAHLLADRSVFPLEDEAWRAFKRRLSARPRRKPRLARLAAQRELFRCARRLPAAHRNAAPRKVAFAPRFRSMRPPRIPRRP